MLETVLNKIKGIVDVRGLDSFKPMDTSAFSASDDPDIRMMADILKFISAKPNWTPEEAAVLELVNSIRNDYLSSTRKLYVRDYGAGANNSISTEKQSIEGVKKEVSVAQVCRTAATREKWGELLFKIIREFKFSCCLELGTNLGISAAYQLGALKLNGMGKLITLEGDEGYAKLADASLKRIQYNNYSIRVGRFADSLPLVLGECDKIDFAFIDGHHDKTATLMYFEHIYPFLAPKSVVIFDDISWSEGMKTAWSNINSDEKVKAAFDLSKWGICLIDKNKNQGPAQYYSVVS